MVKYAVNKDMDKTRKIGLFFLKFLSNGGLVLAITGFIAILATKYHVYTLFVDSLVNGSFNINEYLYTIQIDLSVFVFLLILILFRPKKQSLCLVRKWFILPLIIIIGTVYLIFSLIDYKWVIESGNHINFYMVQEFIMRSSDLISIIIKYSKDWAALLFLIILTIIIAKILKRRLHPGEDSGDKYNLALTGTSFIFFFLLITLIIENNAVFILRTNPKLVAIRESAFLQLVKDSLEADKRPSDVETGNRNVEIQSISSKPNIVFIVLESVGIKYTPLSSSTFPVASMPFLTNFANEGLRTDNMRTIIPHTTKSLYSILSGMYPVPSTYIAETELNFPVTGIAEYLKKFGYQSAFFQSASGEFERRPALVSNLGFDDFKSGQEIDPHGAIYGMFNMDDKIMISEIDKWSQSHREKPFVLGILTSVTHHPYSLPGDTDTTYATYRNTTDQEKILRYIKTLEYTDIFLHELITLLENQNTNSDGTIYIIVGDHGEGFGEHGKYAHSQNVYDEALRVPFVMVWKNHLAIGQTSTHNLSQVDIVPTVLNLIGAKYEGYFSGEDIFNQKEGRNLYFMSTYDDSSVGMINESNRQFIFNLKSKGLEIYDLNKDPEQKSNLSNFGKLLIQTSEINEAIQRWKAKYYENGYDKKSEPAMIYNWLCEPTGYGACKLLK